MNVSFSKYSFGFICLCVCIIKSIWLSTISPVGYSMLVAKWCYKRRIYIHFPLLFISMRDTFYLAPSQAVKWMMKSSRNGCHKPLAPLSPSVRSSHFMFFSLYKIDSCKIKKSGKVRGVMSVMLANPRPNSSHLLLFFSILTISVPSRTLKLIIQPFNI